MELRIASYTKRSFSMVSVHHGDHPELVFNAGGYSNAKPGAVKQDDTAELGERVELFEEINEFISKLSKADQDKLYQCYVRIDQAFGLVGSLGEGRKGGGNELNELLSEAMKDIYDIVEFEDLRDYILTNRKIKLPPELSDEYETTDKITPLYIQRTYRKGEYIDLLANALGMRLMVPVWGSYMPISGKEDRIAMKEYSAFKLLERSKIFYQPTYAELGPNKRRMPVFERLETYIRANLSEGEYELEVAFKHLSSERVPEYLTALALCRKISVAPLSVETEKQHLMKIVYNYCCGNNTRLPAAFGGRIKPKTDSEAPSDDNGSVLCIYKMKEQVSAGDLVMVQMYIMRYLKSAEAIDQDIDLEMVENCVSQSRMLGEFDPIDSQIALCLWVMSTVVPGCMIEMLDRETLLTAMGTAQAILWHWDLPQLAILLTAALIPLEEDEVVAGIPRTPISNANMDMLNAIYPYSMPESKRNEYMSNNPGVRGIEDMATQFFKNEWTPQCNKKLAASYYRSDKTRRIEVSPDIRDQIATLLIRLNEYSR